MLPGTEIAKDVRFGQLPDRMLRQEIRAIEASGAMWCLCFRTDG